MFALNFDEANRISENINKINLECEKILTSCNSVNVGGISSFSPSTVSIHEQIHNKVENLPTATSGFYNDFTASVQKCIELYEEIYGKVNDINTLESGKINPDGSISSNYTILGYEYDGNMMRVSYGGREFLVTNTLINCFDYAQYIHDEGIFQNNYGFFGSDCKLLSQYYAVDMMEGYKTPKKVMGTNDRGSANRMKNSVTSETDPSVILKFVYEEAVDNGRVTTLQVSQKSPTSRHYVTVVGFTSDVQSYNDLNRDNILVLDPWDGGIHVLSEYGNDGNGRDLYKWKGVYQADGATQEEIALIDSNKANQNNL